MPTLTGLHSYPIKSCAGLALERARLTPWGLEWDRHWMVVDVNDGFVSQRTYPDMARIVPTFEGDCLVVRSDGMPALELPLKPPTRTPSRQVSVWDDSMVAIDEGDRAAQWFSQRLDSTLRLVRFDPSVSRAVSKKWTGEHDAVTQFADGFPILVTGEASLDELNGRLLAKGATPIPMSRFRPNIVVSGLDAYDEDFIETLTIAGSPSVVLRLSKPCARCPITTIDQTDGMRDPHWPHEPLDTLAIYRANPRVGGGLTFGQNAIAIEGDGAWIELGASIDAEWDFA
ncbi:MOSC domain-containing protein [Pararobbsia silviterrae]|uniref:MOSC domain-containing protein n=1 Tax=Pararobbsia silviterrae TaxID=1792498 RepID=A0A494X2Y7_9BURK|nr:MOSC N-terminal beta barrel domain-containing protein [Pararobbsia silviterrae]RKP45057.1 MOSC domain-containing protein [Pararobbsia silviterrae]